MRVVAFAFKFSVVVWAAAARWQKLVGFVEALDGVVETRHAWNTKGVMGKSDLTSCYKRKKTSIVLSERTPQEDSRQYGTVTKASRRKMLAGGWSALRCFRKCMWNDSGNLGFSVLTSV